MVIAVAIVDTKMVVLAAVLVALGLILIAAGWRGATFTLPKKGDTASNVGEVGIRLAMAAAAAGITYVLTGWIVAAVYASGAGFFFLTMKNAKRERHAAIDRVDAIATWVENIRDNISASAGLQQALRMSADQAPEPIRAEVRDLVLRLQHEPVVDSLRRFAADVAHPTADMAVGCLILASSRAAGGLAMVLARTAQAARDSASMMRQIEAGRNASQAQAKLVGAITGGVCVYMVTTAKEFVSSYDSFTGQIVLAIVLTIFSGAVFALHQLAKTEDPQRTFRGVEGSFAPTPLVPEMN